jgi:hypothetical protein
MSPRKRIAASLFVSILVSAVLLLVEHATGSKALFAMQLPGFFACVRIWGIRSFADYPVIAFLVFTGVNALIYWPVIFGLSFLFVQRRRSANARNLP